MTPQPAQSWLTLCLIIFLIIGAVGAWGHDRTIMVLAGLGVVLSLVGAVFGAREQT